MCVILKEFTYFLYTVVHFCAFHASQHNGNILFCNKTKRTVIEALQSLTKDVSCIPRLFNLNLGTQFVVWFKKLIKSYITVKEFTI